MQTKIVMEKIDNTGSKQLIPFIPLIKDACHVYSKYLPTVWIGMLTNMKVPNPKICPIPPVSRWDRFFKHLSCFFLHLQGHYKLNKFVFDESTFQQTVPIKGRFITRVHLIDLKNKNKVMTCLECLINVKEKV